MKKQSKRKTTSFKSSILLLLLMAVLLISSTYAWFTANETVTVSSIQVNVQASNGLQISTDGTTWKALISNADLTTNIATTYAGNTNQVPAELAPVSTAGGVTDGKLDMYYGTVSTNAGGDYILTSTQQTDTKGTTGYYIVFDLFLRVETDTPIYLTPTSQVKYLDGATDVGLQNAARIAFIKEGVGAASDSAATLQALNEGTTADIWEPNYDTHTGAGVQNAKNTYNITTTETGGSVLPYNGIQAEFSASDNVLIRQLTTPDVGKFGAVTPTYTTKNGFDANVAFTTLAKGVTKYRVYMWIEGQDVDCENGASGTDIQFNLQFTQNNG